MKTTDAHANRLSPDSDTYRALVEAGMVGEKEVKTCHPRYDQEQRRIAKRKGYGLITISWEAPGGPGSAALTLNGPAGPKLLKYIQYAQRVAHRKMEEGER